GISSRAPGSPDCDSGLAASRPCRRDGLLDVVAVPELEHQEVPEFPAVVGPSVDVLAQQGANGGRFEDSLFPQPFLSQMGLQAVAALMVDPPRQRNGEPSLPPTEDIPREEAGGCPPKQDLRSRPAHLQLR